MKITMIQFIEMIIGALIFALSLLYLTSQIKTMDHLIDIVKNDMIENRNVYQE